MSGPFGSSQWMYTAGGDYQLEQSIKFAQDGASDANSPKLTKTLGTPTSDKISTLSVWVKRSELGGAGEDNKIFASTTGCEGYINFDGDDKINMYFHNTACNAKEAQIKTNAVFRDVSAWYHIVVNIDTTDGTAADRLILYVNGVRQTFSTDDRFDQNDVVFWNRTIEHRIGERSNMYLAEMHFIDGTVVAPSSFAETGDYGNWKPIEVDGLTYGNNGFYLPFKIDYTVEGFSAVTFRGDGFEQYVGGVGFQSDFTWIKNRTSDDAHTLFDAVRGVTKHLTSNTTAAEVTTAQSLKAFNTDGFTLGTSNVTNAASNYVAWNWDMGGSNATNTAGTIQSTVRANPAYGQSIVTWTGTGDTGTVGTGLTSDAEVVIVKGRTTTDNWSYSDTIQGSGTVRGGYLNGTARIDDTDWSSRLDPSSSTANTIGVYDWDDGNKDNVPFVAYCFHSVSGYSKFSIYAGTGGTHTVTTGFSPAFIIIKQSDANGENWKMYDNARFPNTQQLTLDANSNGVEGGGSAVKINYLATGFQVVGTNADINANNTTYVYLAFADTREYAYWLDQSGRNNDWSSVNDLTESEISVDSPTNNFCTMNSRDVQTAGKLQEGNLFGVENMQRTRGTISVTSGKWYYEFLMVYHHSSTIDVGIRGIGTDIDNADSTDYVTISHPSTNGVQLSVGGSATAEIGTVGSYDILGVAWDMAAETISFTVNNSAIAAATTNVDYSGIPNNDTLSPYIIMGSGRRGCANFGQDSSFAGNKEAQGNTDGNGQGDFYYAPPSGYLALCTKNLPEPVVTPTSAFKALLYTGTGSNQAVSGVGFKPDLLWVKNTATAGNNLLFDVVRGGDGTNLEGLRTDRETIASTQSDEMRSLDSDGFTTDTGGDTNGDGNSIISFNWKAGTGNTAFSESGNNPAGTHNANVAAGFSIVSYVGTGAVGTVSHGLGVAPEMMWIKNRDVDDVWAIYYGDNTDYLKLDLTSATADDAAWWNDTSPTSSVFTVATDHSVNADAENYIAYCWRSVDGFSKIGIYTGNGVVDGAFVNTGFRPSWVFIKRINNGDQQSPMYTSAIDLFNPAQSSIKTEDSVAIQTNQGHLDLLSNGFKAINAEGSTNTNGGTYLFMAFAETPFKYANGR